jgi:hypothetical protein
MLVHFTASSGNADLDAGFAAAVDCQPASYLCRKAYSSHLCERADGVSSIVGGSEYLGRRRQLQTLGFSLAELKAACAIGAAAAGGGVDIPTVPKSTSAGLGLRPALAALVLAVGASF